METVHAGRIYAYDDLAGFVASFDDVGRCAPPGLVKRVAGSLGLRPKQVQQALDKAGVQRQLTDTEMVGRVSHDGETIIRFHRRSIDSRGSYGHVYVVRQPGDDRDQYRFVHDIARTAYWYHSPGTPEAAQARAEYLERKRQEDARQKSDDESRSRVRQALEGMSTDPGLDPFYRGCVYLKNVIQRGSLFDEVQRRLDGIATLGEPNPIVGCCATFIDQ